MRTALFGVIMQRAIAIPYHYFKTTYLTPGAWGSIVVKVLRY
jgi:hypothetical protein